MAMYPTTTSSAVTTSSRVATPASRLQIAAIVILAAGIGWLNGNFIQPIPPVWGLIIDLLHLLPLIALVPLAMSLLSGGVTRGARNGVTGVVAFLLIACAAFIVLGAVNPDPNAVGVHDITDWAVVACIGVGSLLWLASLTPFARRASSAVAR
jgi:hypothetical protein